MTAPTGRDIPEPARRRDLTVAAAILVGLVLVAAAVTAVVTEVRRDDHPAFAQPAAGAVPVEPAARAAWAATAARRTGIPERAVAAYGAAEVAARTELAGCALSWVTLAGIGRVESNHGRFGGAELGADGRPSEPVRGPALDGTDGNREILDTDGGRLDGDTRHDRAAGPLQFIPGTWAQYGADGDGDGRTDPDDLDDAALAAARYLCADDRDLRRGEDWRAAVLAYNGSVPYAERVHREAVGAARS